MVKEAEYVLRVDSVEGVSEFLRNFLKFRVELASLGTRAMCSESNQSFSRTAARTVQYTTYRHFISTFKVEILGILCGFFSLCFLSLLHSFVSTRS